MKPGNDTFVLVDGPNNNIEIQSFLQFGMIADSTYPMIQCRKLKIFKKIKCRGHIGQEKTKMLIPCINRVLLLKHFIDQSPVTCEC